ncbi:LysR family transcriptional regulator [Burkholderia lata]|uniref:Transcriptional regulator, LysR family n=1 Tax=Burkholderia lata (strain ATCC 17760 / DSM 23089 / LMG 22485 / NCIMB 9086 / R18194 / 383) TaxID=482957 RepID=Q39MK4_BURL3|nr:LysR family transcriptional regulator [Burkholderia lata]ABB06312.1 transcriptional regulator, LysR family [Burkholderia lata]
MDPSLLPSLAWFAHVAHHRSFTKAAAEMGVSRANLSQNVKALERRLNVKLLYRTTRDMSLTEEGQRLYDVWYPALVAVERTVDALHEARDAPTGLIRMNTSRVAAKTLIEPHLEEFSTRFPGLGLELVMDDGLANIVADGCDVGIRIGESLAPHMVAVPITPSLEMAVVGTPAYFKRHGEPATPADLVRHNCLRFRQVSGAIHPWEFASPDASGHGFTVEPLGSITTNDDDGMIRAALQGVGLIQHIDIAVQPHLDSGALVRVLQPWCKPFAGFYVYAPTRAQMPMKIRALIDFLVEKREAIVASRARGGRANTAGGKAGR